MSERFDPNEYAPEYAALLHLLQEAARGVPENAVFIIHPENYPRITRSVDRILDVIRRAEPDATHTIEFDPVLGTGLCLRVLSWTFNFTDGKEFAEAAALADYFGAEALVTGETVFSFGFEDARIRVPEAEKHLLEKQSENCYNTYGTQSSEQNENGGSKTMFDEDRTDYAQFDLDEDDFLLDEDDETDDPVDEDEQMEEILLDEELESGLFDED